MTSTAEKEAGAAGLEDELAEWCGMLNAVTARVLDVIARVVETESWQGAGIRSAPQWVAWKCGVSPERARSLVAMARRLGELPETKAALDAGELAEDQVAVIARHAPAAVDAEVATLAHHATVARLRRTLRSYSFATPPAVDAEGKQPDAERPDAEQPSEVRRVSFGYTDDGLWRLSALLPADLGALWERALAEARDALFHQRHPGAEPAAVASDVSWADAFAAIAESYLAGAAAGRPHRARHLVLLHVGTGADGANHGHLHLSPGLSDGLRRYLGCDARIRPIFEAEGKAVSVGRSWRTVPERTRMVIEERDRGCRVPGCEATRWLHCHHVAHWEDGGTTDTANLVALCPHHHRLHHLGRLGISGNADDFEGMVFTDERGRRLTGCSRPAPPGEPLEAAARRLGVDSATWSHPSGERLDYRWVYFNEPAAS